MYVCSILSKIFQEKYSYEVAAEKGSVYQQSQVRWTQYSSLKQPCVYRPENEVLILAGKVSLFQSVTGLLLEIILIIRCENT